MKQTIKDNLSLEEKNFVWKHFLTRDDNNHEHGFSALIVSKWVFIANVYPYK